jgi:hypothetical protein
MFGTEYDSPLPIRLMGIALLNHAFSVMDSLPDDHPLKPLLLLKENLLTRLMAINDAHSCSALAAGLIFREVNQALTTNPGLQTHRLIMESVIPEKWRPR